MLLKKHIAHIALLFAETAILFAVILRGVFVEGDDTALIHYYWKVTYALSVLGISGFVVTFVLRIGLMRLNDTVKISVKAKVLIRGLILMSMTCIVLAGYLMFTEYPERFRLGRALVGFERIASLGGIVVHFDANGGKCKDVVRIVRRGAVYSDNMNVYVLDDERYFSELRNSRINLPRNLLVVSVTNNTDRMNYAHYFSVNSIPLISEEEKWSYVVDVENLKGIVSDWYVGQTWSTNNNVYSHIEESRVGPNDGEWKVRILRLGVNPWSDYNFLDRGVIFVGPGQALDMAFRVSLFAGMGIDKSNYHYVRPGETLACPLPVPTREGYAFEGWFDGDRLITEESKVEKRETHTLKAHWRKL